MTTKTQTDARTSTYLLRSIPRDLWQAVKHRAVDEGISIRDLIIRALEGYLAGGGKKSGS